MHGAGAALLQPAAELRTGQSDRIANYPKQRRVWTYIDIVLLAIYA